MCSHNAVTLNWCADGAVPWNNTRASTADQMTFQKHLNDSGLFATFMGCYPFAAEFLCTYFAGECTASYQTVPPCRALCLGMYAEQL